DQDARRLVAAAVKRVSVVTAVSPRAALDMAFVLISVIGLVRRLADLYGARPGALGLIRLLRLTITHLAVTGSVAASDSVIQQMLGHGVAAKLSARLGEGVLNGLLTARLGPAAIEVSRPLPCGAPPRAGGGRPRRRHPPPRPPRRAGGPGAAPLARRLSRSQHLAGCGNLHAGRMHSCLRRFSCPSIWRKPISPSVPSPPRAPW